MDPCTEVSPQCPVENTVYGFEPNLAANLFFAAFSAVLAVANLILGIRYRSWTFLIAMVLGAVCESIGHVGRVLLHDNVYSEVGFNLQIVLLIIAPAFVAAGIYLTLKHIVLAFGEDHSVLKARYYTWLFICCDIISLALQGIGGGLAATADIGDEQLETGSDIMMTGICVQVVTMTAFGLLAGLYFFRRSRSTKPLPASGESVKDSRFFRLFVAAFTLAYLAVLIRCIYRIAEMAGGWGNELMQSEIDFIVLESTMILIALVAMTVCHPGYCFPPMITQAKKSKSLGDSNLEAP